MAEGASNGVLALHEQGIPLVETQKDLIPFQRFVILEGIRNQQEEQEQQQNNPASAQAGRKNPLAQPNGGSRMSGETVTYVNTHGGDEPLDT